MLMVRKNRMNLFCNQSTSRDSYSPYIASCCQPVRAGDSDTQQSSREWVELIMAKAPDQEHPQKVFGWAAADKSGNLSPFHFSRRYSLLLFPPLSLRIIFLSVNPFAFLSACVCMWLWMCHRPLGAAKVSLGFFPCGLMAHLCVL